MPLPPWPAPLPSTPVLAETAFGRLWLDPSDIVGRTLLGVQGDRDVREGRHPVRADGHFWDGDLLLPLYDECARPGACVVVVGANFGQDALYCARRGARVLAVEAQARLHDLLWKTVEANAYGSRIQPLHWVATDTHGWYVPRQEDTDPSSRAFVRSHDVRAPYTNGGPLDAWVVGLSFFAPVTLVAVDAQGHDLRALKGLRQTLRRERPVVVFEYEAHLAAELGDTWGDYESFVAEIGYTMRESQTHPNNWVARPAA